MHRGQRYFDARPWYYRFSFYFIAFGALTYLIQSIGIAAAVFSGLAFATLMTLFDSWRLRRKRARAPQ